MMRCLRPLFYRGAPLCPESLFCRRAPLCSGPSFCSRPFSCPEQPSCPEPFLRRPPGPSGRRIRPCSAGCFSRMPAGCPAEPGSYPPPRPAAGRRGRLPLGRSASRRRGLRPSVSRRRSATAGPRRCPPFRRERSPPYSEIHPRQSARYGKCRPFWPAGRPGSRSRRTVRRRPSGPCLPWNLCNAPRVLPVRDSARRPLCGAGATRRHPAKGVRRRGACRPCRSAAYCPRTAAAGRRAADAPPTGPFRASGMRSRQPCPGRNPERPGCRAGRGPASGRGG